MATSCCITSSARIAIIGERSIMPARGITRRKGSMIGSVTRNSNW